MEIEQIKAQIEQATKKAYYMNPNMIKFLLLENLALKTLLHEKGLFTPEEYKEAQKKADVILNQTVNSQVEEFSRTNVDIQSLFNEVEATRPEDVPHVVS